MHHNSIQLFKRHGLPLLRPGMSVIEIGPDWLIPGGMVRPLVMGAGCDYSFADLKNTPDGVRMADEYSLLAPAESYDAVVSLSVAEHVRSLRTWLDELKRITRPGGLLIFVNPVSWPYHESPHDCWRIMPEGWKTLFEDASLAHLFSWTGNIVPLETWLVAEHGPHLVTDTIAIARRCPTSR